MDHTENITAQEVVQSLFNPTEKVCLRVFADRKGDPFTGTKIDLEAARFSGSLDQLHKHNAQNRGIFFVVNYGGQKDEDITRINAQFMEMDDKPLDEQQKLINEFPIPPSMIIQTRKSLHTYWFMKNADLDRFRPIQKALVKHFGGDPACINESRVMRLPGFYHCKSDPVMVKCISFHPERRYSQDELAACLPEIEQAAEPKEKLIHGTQKGIEIVLASCDFMKHCRDEAAELSEHDWYAMITNLAPFEGGEKTIHDMSAPYPGYDPEKTDQKIQHFLSSKTGPMTCKTIAEKGWKCPKLESGECSCRSPAAKCWMQLDAETVQILLDKVPAEGNIIADFQSAMAFTEKYLYNMEPAMANMVIGHMVKDHFKLKTEDARALLSSQKKLAKQNAERAEASARESDAADLPDWYEVTRAGLVFLPAVLASHMAKTENVFYAAEQYYKYQGGVYKPMTDLEARNMVRLKMDERYTRMHQITDAEGQWKLQIGQDSRLLNPNPYIINCLNGMYNVMEDTLLPHTPDYLSTVQLSVNYIKDAKCPRFEKFLAESIDEDQIPLVQEMLGYFLVPVNRAQKCFVIVGAAGAGKSKLLLVINEVLLGRENVSNVSWQALNERFKTAELFGKLANIFADLPTKNIDDNGIFKALVGEDYLTVERKNKDPFSFVSQARLLFSCNNIPRNYGDRSDGFYRRLIIIRFAHAVPEALRDPELLSKFQAESDGIFQYALEGLRRLMANGFKFSETESNKEELRKYREDSNSVLAFIRDCCEMDVDAESGRMETYQRYRSYCEDSGLNPFSQRMFNAEIDTNFSNIKRAKDTLGKRKTWRGIRLLPEMDELD